MSQSTIDNNKKSESVHFRIRVSLMNHVRNLATVERRTQVQMLHILLEDALAARMSPRKVRNGK
jgi:translation initiation factor IF-1